MTDFGVEKGTTKITGDLIESVTAKIAKKVNA